MEPNQKNHHPENWVAPNYYQRVTNAFITQLHQGIIPWRAGTVVPFHDFAQNYHSAHIYKGINWLYLNLVNAQEAPYYLTWYQAQKLGGSVLKGTKSETVFYFNTYYKDPTGEVLPKVRGQQLEQEQQEVQKISYLKPHKIFNLKKTTGIAWEPPKRYKWKKLKLLLTTIKDRHKIEYDTITQSFYDVEADSIILPSEIHEEEEIPSYLLFVSLIHWTGHESRLGRDGVMNNSLDCAYDIEEQMVADIGASMLSRLVGVQLPSTIEQGEEDVLSFWIQALEENNRFIFRVAARAQEAVTYLLAY